MTQFQMLALGLFLGVVVVAYRKELVALGKALLKRGGVETPTVQQSIAVTIVDDLISVTELRDKLAAEDCPQGVDACTNLLRVIVEHIPPAKTV